MNIVRSIQRNHPQQCMQCSSIKISKLCEQAAINKNSDNMLKCGNVPEPLYGMTYHTEKKGYCAWVVVECHSRLPELPAVIVVDRFDFNATITANFYDTIANVTDVEIDTRLFIEEIQKVDKREVSDFVEKFSPFIYISPEKKNLTSTKIHCNNDGVWEATIPNGKKVVGIEKIHCIVGKAF